MENPSPNNELCTDVKQLKAVNHHGILSSSALTLYTCNDIMRTCMKKVSVQRRTEQINMNPSGKCYALTQTTL